MGLETIPDRKSGQFPSISWINNFKDVLCGVFAPRNPNGIVSDKTVRLGSSDFKFKYLAVSNGYIKEGTVLPWYDYNGAIPVPQGWMICNGTSVTQSNYDAQHTAGDWVKYGISSSSLSGTAIPLFDNSNSFYVRSDSTSVGATSGNAATFNFNHDHGTPTTSTPTNMTTSSNVSAYTTQLGYVLENQSHTHATTTSSATLGNNHYEGPYLRVKYIIKVSK